MRRIVFADLRAWPSSESGDALSPGPRYDVVIAGGGLAGLCLAIQLMRTRPDTRVLVVEKSADPAPRAAHKVGESSVEMASHYFSQVLGLSDLLADELPKFGLRFLIGSEGGHDVARRTECGPSHLLHVPSYQIDRGQFENALHRRATELGARVVRGSSVRSFEPGPAARDHVVEIDRAGERERVRCRWLVDASGRAALLKKQLGLTKRNRHDVNAAWFRIDHPIDIDDWSEDISWSTRLKHSRRLSTNHLMGEGYWVWLIPLPGDRTSIGVVADASLHPFAELASFDRVLGWLDRHEPYCARIVRELAHTKMDFGALKDYSHDVRRMFSGDRWCLAGDAGVFVDPLYSPGSDFIGLANGFTTDLIVRDLRGEDVSALAARHDQTYRTLARTYLINFQRQYPLMGNAGVMTTKIVWDFVMYWGGVALLFFGDRVCDEAFMARARPTMHRFAAINVRRQAHFRDWAAATKGAAPRAGTFIDYAELEFLATLNAELLLDHRDDDALLARLERNLALAEALHREIFAEAGRVDPALANGSGGPADTEYLGQVFASLRPVEAVAQG